MKKLLYILVLLLMVFGITACGDEEEDKDLVSPVISGANAISVEVFGEFDQLQGVSALDEVDGDITSSIVITGDFSINSPGVYPLTYTVSDAAGNETSVIRQVTVTAVDIVVDILLETVTFDQIIVHVLIDYTFTNLDALTNVVQTIATETYLDHFDHIDGNRYTLTIYAYQLQADYDSLDATYGYQVFTINSIGHPGLSSATNALLIS